MIVYSDRRWAGDPRKRLAALQAGLTAPRPDLSRVLVEAGMLEAGIADALLPKEDGEPEAVRAFRTLTLDLAHAARGDGRRLRGARARIEAIARGPLPARLEIGEPEGFAFYALYPEAYAEAARRFLRAERPERAVVVGLRSIGTTLSAVVAAELEAAGVAVRSFTVRPRGHPWDREVRLAPGLRARLAEGSHVLIVDEGPGISGSSFAGAAEAASEAGVADGRIHLFPSWDADGSGLRSGRARERWGRHRRWVVPFEEAVLPRLTARWGDGRLRDLSGGLWRDDVCDSGRWPAVQPQHERRKYLIEHGTGPLLLKFAGLGERGPRMLARAERQAAAGLGPPVEGLADGFLALRWVEGRPVEAADGDVPGFLGRHLAFVAEQEPSSGPVRFDDLMAMTLLNVAEGLGEDAAARIGWMERMRDAVEARPAVAVDGRMLPHEVLRTAEGFVKCDGLDHHDDHFWPGTQDIAWDLAGAMVEFGMGEEVRERLLAEFEAQTGDRGARAVLPFHEAAYLAWRLGYATLAAETLGEGEDGPRMAGLRDRYGSLLRVALERGG